jgi:hypothetical protein
MALLSAGVVVAVYARLLAVGVAGRGLATVAAVASQTVQQQPDQGQQQLQRCTQCWREVFLLFDLLFDLRESLFDLDVIDLHGSGDSKRSPASTAMIEASTARRSAGGMA